MSIENKSIAAREAAAKHSTNPRAAVMEYISLTGQSGDCSDEEFHRIQEEMLSLIKPYRHPVGDELVEYMLFIDPAGLQSRGVSYSVPFFVTELEKAGVAAEIVEVIKTYVKEAEVAKIKRNQYQHELFGLKGKIKHAGEIYDSLRKKRSEQRNAAVVQFLGFSTGFLPRSIDKKKAYYDYVMLIRNEAMSRQDAVDVVQMDYGFNSDKATARTLHEQRRLVINKWKEVSPTHVPEIRKRLKGLVPQYRE